MLRGLPARPLRSCRSLLNTFGGKAPGKGFKSLALLKGSIRTFVSGVRGSRVRYTRLSRFMDLRFLSVGVCRGWVGLGSIRPLGVEWILTLRLEIFLLSAPNNACFCFFPQTSRKHDIVLGFRFQDVGFHALSDYLFAKWCSPLALLGAACWSRRFTAPLSHRAFRFIWVSVSYRTSAEAPGLARTPSALYENLWGRLGLGFIVGFRVAKLQPQIGPHLCALVDSSSAQTVKTSLESNSIRMLRASAEQVRHKLRARGIEEVSECVDNFYAPTPLHPLLFLCSPYMPMLNI